MKQNELLLEFQGDSLDWMLYFLDQRRGERIVRGRVAWMPSPSEIALRCVDLRWMEEQGFSRRVIVNVLEYDNPSIWRVRQMVARHGVEETVRRISGFLVKTEYDGDGK